MDMTEVRRRIIMDAPHLETVSGEIVTIKNATIPKMKSVKASFSSVSQDLHGYDQPWIGGERKNLFDKDHAAKYERGISTNLMKWIPVTGGASYAFKCLGNTDYTISAFNDSLTAFKVGCITVTPYNWNDPQFQPEIVGYVSVGGPGSTTIRTAIAATYIIIQLASAQADNTLVQIELGTTGTTYEPYENICPITGGISATHMNFAHRNLFDVDHATFVPDKYIDANGEVQTNTSYHYIQNFIRVKPNTTYAVQVYKPNNQSAGFTVPLYDANKQFIQRKSGINASTAKGLRTGAFTTTADTHYIRFSCGDAMTNLMIEEGSLAHDYEPFKKRYEVTFPALWNNLFDKDHATVYDRGFTDTGKWLYYEGATSYAFPCEPDTDYVVHLVGTGITFFRAGYISVNLPILSSMSPEIGNITRLTAAGTINVHTGSDATYVVVQINTASVNTTMLKIEKGTSATPFDLYNNVLFSGTVDLATGEINATSLMWTLTGQEAWSHSWGTSSSNGAWRLNPTPIMPGTASNILANFGKYGNATSGNTTHAIYFAPSSGYVNIRNWMSETRGGKTAAQKATEWKNYLAERYNAGNPLQILCKGLNVTRRLTSEQIKLLREECSIWNDDVPIEVKFWTH